ncbi:tripartite tricarboxylate transporter substrate binding protein [Salinarimonas sp.]|uniref:tripartite tricarboxylate transporter substrate binding protein n=1 Tax=Salinarimonas sp. TaxID=2766526 RepID=UPI00391B95B9
MRMHPSVAALAAGLALGTGLAIGAASEARADFPDGQTIRVVTPYGAGGGIDIAARILSSVADEHVGTRVEVVNMPGAGGLDAASYVHGAEADGTTLIISDYGPLITLALREDTPYAIDDWVPLVQVTEIAPTFVARTDAPFDTIEGFVEAARAQPGGIPITHGTYISSSHLPLLRLEQLTGAQANHVPTSGGGETVQFLLGGTVPVAVTTPATIASAIEAGTARALAVATAERVPSLPETPTLREAGFDIVMPVWYTIFAPASVPEERRTAIAERIAAAYESPAAQELAERARIVVRPITGAEVETIFADTRATVEATLAELDD